MLNALTIRVNWHLANVRMSWGVQVSTKVPYSRDLPHEVTFNMRGGRVCLPFEDFSRRICLDFLVRELLGAHRTCKSVESTFPNRSSKGFLNAMQAANALMIKRGGDS